MSFKVKYKGLEVICDTFDDLDSLATIVEARSSQGVKPVAPDSGQNGHRQTASIAQCVKGLTRKQQELLAVLLKNGGAMSPSAIIQTLGFKSANQLSGLVATIHKNALRVGLEASAFFDRRNMSNDPREKNYQYFIPASAIDEVSSALDFF